MQYLPLVLIASAQAVVLDLESVTEGLNDDDLSLDYDTVASLASLPLHCHSVSILTSSVRCWMVMRTCYHQEVSV